MNPSPVAQALAQQRFNELVANENAIASNVVSALGYSRADPGNAWQPFAQWCQQYGVRYLPARPTTIAGYVLDLQRRGKSFDEILSELSAVANLHDVDLGNPVSTGVVAAVLRFIVPSESRPPAGWTGEEQLEFLALPPWAQAIISRREKQRDVHLNRISQELADFKRKVAENEVQNKTNSGNDTSAENTGDAEPNGDAEKAAAPGDVVALERSGGIDGAGRPAKRHKRPAGKRANA